MCKGLYAHVHWQLNKGVLRGLSAFSLYKNKAKSIQRPLEWESYDADGRQLEKPLYFRLISI